MRSECQQHPSLGGSSGTESRGAHGGAVGGSENLGADGADGLWARLRGGSPRVVLGLVDDITSP